MGNNYWQEVSIHKLWENNKISLNMRNICIRRGLLTLKDVYDALPILREEISIEKVKELENVIKLSSETVLFDNTPTEDEFPQDEIINETIEEDKDEIRKIQPIEQKDSFIPSFKKKTSSYKKIKKRKGDSQKIIPSSKNTNKSVLKSSKKRSSNNVGKKDSTKKIKDRDKVIKELLTKGHEQYTPIKNQLEGDDIFRILSTKTRKYCKINKIEDYNQLEQFLDKHSSRFAESELYRELKFAINIFSSHQYRFDDNDSEMMETLYYAAIASMRFELKLYLEEYNNSQSGNIVSRETVEQIEKPEEEVDDETEENDDIEEMSEVCQNIVEYETVRRSQIAQSIKEELDLQNIQDEIMKADCANFSEFGTSYPIKRFKFLDRPLWLIFQSTKLPHDVIQLFDSKYKDIAEKIYGLILSAIQFEGNNWIRNDETLEGIKIKLFQILSKYFSKYIRNFYEIAILYLDYLVKQEINERVRSDKSLPSNNKRILCNYKDFFNRLNIQEKQPKKRLPFELQVSECPLDEEDYLDWWDYEVACYQYLVECHCHLSDINDYIMIDAHDKENEIPFYVTIDGKCYSDFEEYCNSDELDEEEVFLRIATGSRTPQSDDEYLGITPHYEILYDDDDDEAEDIPYYETEHVPMDIIQIPFSLSQHLDSIRLSEEEMEEKYLSSESYWYNEKYDIVFRKIRILEYPRVFWKWKTHIEHETTLQDELFKETVLNRIAITKVQYDSF